MAPDSEPLLMPEVTTVWMLLPEPAATLTRMAESDSQSLDSVTLPARSLPVAEKGENITQGGCARVRARKVMRRLHGRGAKKIVPGRTGKVGTVSEAQRGE